MSWKTILLIGAANTLITFTARALPLVWAGMIIGVSLIATPVKFKAPLLDLPAAMDVGRVTFDFFNSIEWVMLMTLAVLSFIRKVQVIWILIVLCCLSLQSYWLMPILNARVFAIIQGNVVQSSIHHSLYGCAEAIKLIALFCICSIPSLPVGLKRNMYDGST